MLDKKQSHSSQPREIPSRRSLKLLKMPFEIRHFVETNFYLRKIRSTHYISIISMKLANVTPVPKNKPVTDINQHLRPISLTCSSYRLAEEHVIEKFVAPAILKSIDQNQYGGVPKSSAKIALISMLHNWTKATDGTLGSPIIDGKYIFGSKKCVFILVLLCPQLY